MVINDRAYGSKLKMRTKKPKMKKGISVILPFYNSQDTLLESAKSLLNQKRNKNLPLEVLLIDNNSTEDSGKIGHALETVYPDIFRYIQCSEQGVSSARNLGLQLATKEYVMFLDADDAFSLDTVQNVYNFFDKNEDRIEIVFFRRYFMYIDKKGERTYKSHPRNNLFPGTGVYKEEEFGNKLYYMTLNIAIKNNKQQMFDTEIPYGEDMVFISNILGKNSTIGYVENAHYNYRFSDYSTINKYQSPVYNSELLLSNMEKQFAPYLDRGEKIPKYIQSLAFNEIAWRYSSVANKLFPYHLGKNQFEIWNNKFRKLLRLIDDDIILNYPTLDSFHRYSILELKDEPIKVALFDRLDFRKNGVQVLEEKNFETIISDFKIVDNKLYIYSFLKMKLGNKINCRPFVSINGIETELSIWESISSRYKKRDKSNYFPAYKLELDLNNLQTNDSLDIYFYYKIGNEVFNIKKYYSVKNRLLDMNDQSLKFEDSTEVKSENTVNNISLKWLKNFHLLVTRVDDDEAQEIFDLRTDEMSESIQSIRDNWVADVQTKNVWLYVDNFNTVDNAFYQYVHDINKNDGIERYYVYKKDFLYIGRYVSKHKIDIDRMNFVLYGSDEHKKLIMRAKFVLASYNEYFATVVPFTKKELLDLSDILDFKYIYLQHGVLHAKAPQTYDVERTYIDKIVTSTDYEGEVFTNELHYDRSDLLQVGMSRFDLHSQSTNKLPRILFAPSWRSKFVGDLNTFDENGDRQINVEEFLHSQYFNSLVDIIQSDELEKFLDRHGLELDIKLHPIFSGTLDILEQLINGRKHINVLKEQKIDSDQYSIFVTDFSSYVFDAVANKTPIIYYELDREEFLAGNHTYRELYLGFEFGDVVDNVSSFVKTLKNLARRKYTVEPRYLEKMNSFYNYPKHPREELYKRLKLMEKKLND